MKKKMIAPIIITVVFILYLFIYCAMLMTATEISHISLLFAIPLLLLGAGMIYTLYTRIKEIRSGEEDDLDNY